MSCILRRVTCEIEVNASSLSRVAITGLIDTRLHLFKLAPIEPWRPGCQSAWSSSGFVAMVLGRVGKRDGGPFGEHAGRARCAFMMNQCCSSARPAVATRTELLYKRRDPADHLGGVQALARHRLELDPVAQVVALTEPSHLVGRKPQSVHIEFTSRQPA